MAIDNTALATKLGKLFGGLNELNVFRGTTIDSRTAALRTAYGTDPDGLLYTLTADVTSLRTTLAGYAANLSGFVSSTIIDVVQTDRGWANTSIGDALAEWLRQFKNAAQTFAASPVTLALAQASGAPAIVADYTFHTSSLGEDGLATDFGIPDKYLITILADADSGGTRWSELLNVVGKANTGDVLDAAYPTGSGVSTAITVTDPATNSGVLSDGDFNNYSSAAFTSWTRLAGNTATQVFRAANDLRLGVLGFSLDLKSDGVNVTGVKQSVSLTASTVYSLHFAVAVQNATMATAKVYVTIRRADTNAILVDDQAVNISKASSAMNVPALGAWTHYVYDFATPKRLPSAGVYIDIRLADGTTVTTPATTNTEVQIDHVVLQPMPALYTRGVRLAVYSGAVEAARTDQWEYNVTLTSGTISGYMIRWLNRTLGLSTLSLKFPTTTGTATQLDSLIS